jgi:hypothetical protein
MRVERTIHYTELRPAEPGEPGGQEWNTYLREVGRLLAEGHEGKWALIKGDDVIGLFDSREEARAEGLRRFLLQAQFIHQIRAYEPVVRLRARW